MKKVFKVSIFYFVWLILNHVFSPNSEIPISAQTLPTQSITAPQVTISVSLGTPILKLWGYGAPNGRIEISGDRVYDFTYSRSDGYFEFPRAYLPAPSDVLYPELCLSEIDQMGRATPPTCIPPLPATEFSYNIGPVILPPTLSLTEGSVAPSSQAGASGLTIPLSEVKIILAEDRGGQALTGLRIVETAKAYYIPNYTVKSDSRGYFSFNMPSASAKTWRVFAVTNYSQGASSPKSNTLKFEILSPIIIATENIWALVLSLLTLPALIILEIVVVLLIITAIVLSKKGKKGRREVAPNIVDPVRQYQNYLKSKRLI